MVEECVFCKIALGVIPVQAIYENAEFIAFRDQNAQAPVHALLIPRAHFATIMEVKDQGLLGRAMLAIQEVAKLLGVDEEGFRTVINCRDNGGQTVHHLHYHILGGRFMQWPPG